MIPVEQTKFVGEESNCYQACLATILELDLGIIPNFPFRDGAAWLDRLNEFMRRYGLAALFLRHAPDMDPPPGYSILTISGVFGRRPHAVCCLDGVGIWDPNPKNPPIFGKKLDEIEKKFWTVFVATNPASVRKMCNQT